MENAASAEGISIASLKVTEMLVSTGTVAASAVAVKAPSSSAVASTSTTTGGSAASVNRTTTAEPGSVAPVISTAATLAMFITSPVTAKSVTTGATVFLVTVIGAEAPGLPAGSVAMASTDISPSAKAVASAMTVKAPSSPAVTGSVSTTVTVSVNRTTTAEPGSATPVISTAAALAMFITSPVTATSVGASGATVSLVTVIGADQAPGLPAGSVAMASTNISPSAKVAASTVMANAPASPAVPVASALTSARANLTVTSEPGSAMPVTSTAPALARFIRSPVTATSVGAAGGTTSRSAKLTVTTVP
ncbi:MAG: hypothetical protein DDT29_00942 [Dehalococcoidia bacterium]|nr:hypothetical protein [Bacillota bacterium]